MSMLSRLFGSDRELSHADPERRIAAIQRLDADSEGGQQRLLERLKSETEPTVQATLLERVTDANALCEHLAIAGLQRAAGQRIAVLVHGGHSELTAQLRSSPSVMATVAACGPLPDELIDYAAAEFDSEEALPSLAEAVVRTEQRLKLLDRITNPNALERLEKTLKGRDKKAYRKARELLAANRQRTADEARIRQELDRLSERMQALAARGYDSLAEREAAHIESSWTEQLELLRSLVAVEDPSGSVESLQTRFEAIASGVREAHQRELREAGEPESTDREVASAEPESTPVDGDLEAAARSVAELHARMETGRVRLDDPAPLRSALTFDCQRWRAAANERGVSDHAAAEFDSIVQQIEYALGVIEELRAHASPLEVDPPPASAPQEPEQCADLWRKVAQIRGQLRDRQRVLSRVSWPPPLLDSDLVESMRKQIADGDQFIVQCEALAERLRADLASAEQQIEAAIAEGELSNALKLRSRGRRLLRSLPSRAQQEAATPFNAIAQRVEELKDWQVFATSPKRLELCEQMEALASNTASPEVRAEQVKGLRAAWNALGSSQGDSDRELATRFDAAAEVAFEPCRIHFEELAKVRQDNAAAREALCGELEDFAARVDWNQVNWKQVDAILRTARGDWRKLVPVERSGQKAQQARFEAATQPIAERLEAEQQRNLRSLTAIVQRAEALLEDSRPIGDRTDEAKQLQQQWKAIGVTPRREQQDLWKTFRKHCDELFQQRETTRNASNARRQDHAEQARTLLSTVETLLEASTSEAWDDGIRQRLDEAIEQIDGLDLTNHERRRVEQNAQRLSAELNKLQAHAADQRQRQRIRDLVDLDRTLRAGDRPLDDETIAQAPNWAREAFAARLRASSGSPAAEARRLVIEAEILAGLESTEADAGARMEIQVERLARSARGDDQQVDALRDLLRRWLATPIAEDADTQRFYAACDALIETS